jgi:hypothetical protein
MIRDVSGSRFLPIQDPGTRGRKGSGSWIPDPGPQHCDNPLNDLKVKAAKLAEDKNNLLLSVQELQNTVTEFEVTLIFFKNGESKLFIWKNN